MSGLLLAKFAPLRHASHVVQRTRLLTRLLDAREQALILITAPAGYGKTTLLQQYVTYVDRPTAWLSLDEADNDHVVFTRALLAAVRRCFPAFGNDLARALERGAGAHTLGQELSNALYALEDDLLLVLDNFHHASDSPGVAIVLGTVLRYPPPRLQLIVAGRDHPSLPTAHLAARRLASGLGLRDLTLDEEEAAAILERLRGRPPTPEEAATVLRTAQGWASGVVLLALSAEEVPGAHGVDRTTVYEYLASQVLLAQPNKLRQSLLSLSCLRHLTVEACAEVCELSLPEAQHTLDDLERHSVFLVRPNQGEDERPMYRFHDLFREFLQESLRRDDRRRYYDLHRRAGQYMERQGLWAEAVSHYQAAEQPELVAALLRRVGPGLVRQGQWSSVLAWLRAIDERQLASDVELLLLRCAASREGADANLAIASARSVLNHAGATRAQRQQAAAHLVNALRLTGQRSEAIKLAERELTEPNLAIDARALLLYNLSLLYAEMGLGEQAISVGHQALSVFDGLGDLINAARVYHSLGLAERVLGHYGRARANYEEALRRWDVLGDITNLVQTANNLAVVHQLCGEYEQALHVLEDAARRGEGRAVRRPLGYLYSTFGDVYRDLWRPNDAEPWYQRGLETARAIEERWLMVTCLDGLAHVERLRWRTDAAIRYCEQATALAEVIGSPIRLALCRTTAGCVALDAKRPAEALACFDSARATYAGGRNRREQAQLEFLLACARFALGDLNEALERLAVACGLADELGVDEFMVVDGRRFTDLLKLGIKQNAGNMVRLRSVLSRIRQREQFGLRRAPEPTVTRDGAPAAGRVKVRALGEVAVWVNGTEITTRGWGRAKALELALLLLDGPRTREALEEALWPEEGAPNTSALHVLLHAARQAVGSDFIVHERGRYQVGERWQVDYDVRDFERAAAVAERTRARLALRAALAIYQGEFFPTCYDEWAEARRLSLAQHAARLLALLCEKSEAEGDLEEARECAERLLAMDDLDEAAVATLLRAHLALGTPATGVRIYSAHLERLRAAGLTPEPATEALYRRALRQAVGQSHAAVAGD